MVDLGPSPDATDLFPLTLSPNDMKESRSYRGVWIALVVLISSAANFATLVQGARADTGSSVLSLNEGSLIPSGSPERELGAERVQVRLLTREVDALATRLAWIDSAVKSIEISTFQFRDDATGGQVLAHLLDAVSRGVKVRVIVDAHPGSNSLPKALMQYLIERGLLLRERPFDVRYKLELGRPRLHDKLFIVDDLLTIVGGRNLEDGFFGNSAKSYVDQDIALEGIVAHSIRTYFDQRWSECLTAQPRLIGAEAKRTLKKQVHSEWNAMTRECAQTEIEKWLENARSANVQAFDLGCFPASEWTEHSLPDSQLLFLHDQVGGRKRDCGAITEQIYRSLSAARCSIAITTPYCAMTPELKRTLRAARERGVRVQLITNSLDSTDQIVAHAAYANDRRWFLRSGIELYEFCGPHTLHSKLIIIDGQTSIVGSHNLDYLSERRNSETAIRIHDRDVAEELLQNFQALKGQSRALRQGDLFRYEARESDATADQLREFRQLRKVTPFIKKYL